MIAEGWIGGVLVRRMESGQVPVADQLCTRCGFYRHVAGRDLVADFMRSDPIRTHRASCPHRRIA